MQLGGDNFVLKASHLPVFRAPSPWAVRVALIIDRSVAHLIQFYFPGMTFSVHQCLWQSDSDSCIDHHLVGYKARNCDPANPLVVCNLSMNSRITA